MIHFHVGKPFPLLFLRLLLFPLLQGLWHFLLLLFLRLYETNLPCVVDLTSQCSVGES